MDNHQLSFDDWDEVINPPPAITDFDRVVERALTRRGFLGGTLAFGGFSLLASTAMPNPAQGSAAPAVFSFEAIAASTRDTVTVPPGYSAQVVVRWGDPMWSGVPELDRDTGGTAASQARAFGDCNDGMDVFEHGDRTLLVVNNEFTNRGYLWPNKTGDGPSDDDIRKGMVAHGVSIVEIAKGGGGWTVVKDSPLNRRITPETPMTLTGAAAGDELVRTAGDLSGTRCLGTWNNCGNGVTPWGTYLTCEENFNGYFSTSDPDHTVLDDMQRYGISTRGTGYFWAKIDPRFDFAQHPNEPNCAGCVVEIDPRDPTSVPKKRTSLGRFKHENAEAVVNGDGRVVVYICDDEAGEFLYRYVSDRAYVPGGETEGLLDDGTLSVAKFHDDGTGEWLALTPGTTGMARAAEVAVNTRRAASDVGATTMDRPEWVASHPDKAEVYCALTKNQARGGGQNAGGDPMTIGGPNPREDNRYGQIVRWWPDGSDHAADGFTWDLYVLAGNPSLFDDARAGSENVTQDNMFHAPDGLKFDSTGVLWIQTDGNYSNANSYAGMGNNQMLAGDPVSGEIRRFLVGPRQCEVTGLTWSADRHTMFVGIQHPGSRGDGHWPDGGDAYPRSSVVAITRDDGGLVG